jgi:hypothetical protein
MALFIAGGVVLAAAVALDLMFRIRMTRLGHWSALFKGGSFNYAEYHRLGMQQGWAAWPVYLMWALYTCGVVLLAAGVLRLPGPPPRHGI